MPIYEYECESCGRVTEALRSIAEADAPAGCEHCGHRRTRRLHSVFAAGSNEHSMPQLPTAGCPRCGDPEGPCVS